MTKAYSVGHLVDGRYEVKGVLGKGAHGVVYAAEDTIVGSRVALKCLAPDLAADAGFKIRMHREARAMGALSGTSATQIFAFNKAADGALYIVMELLEGRDFEVYLREIEKHGAHIDLRRLVTLLAPIAETLDRAHAASIIHRDVKPANIFVLDTFARGGVRLLDFGLAKDLNATALTQEGMVAGSPGYIAPEIWRGRAKQADGRIDVYSMGVVAFRALVGDTPFDSSQPLDKFLITVTRAPRPSLRKHRPDLPEGVDAWIEKALAIDPAARFATVGAMWDALRALAEIKARPVPAIDPRAETWEVEIDVEIEEEVASLRSSALPSSRRPF
jgi:serine/threonine-protein kinase